MNGIWYYAIAFLVIWVIALLFKDKLENLGVKVEFPLIMWKTTSLKGFINKIANFSPKFWKWFMNIGIIISFGAMIFITYSLFASLTMLNETATVAVLLPGVEIPGSPIYVPFFYGFLALATVLIIHEFAHGILSQCENVSIKSIGLLLLAILPGAFVEPDEEEMGESKRISKLRIYAAGSMANMTLAAIALILCIGISTIVVPSVFLEEGIEIDSIVNNSPTYGVLSSGMIIKAINNYTISDSNSYKEATNSLKPNQNASIKTNNGTYIIKLAKNPKNSSKGYMGIYGTSHYVVKEKVSNIMGDKIPWILFNLLELFKWIYFLNFAVGTFNLLPMKPLDGGHMFETLLSYKLPENIFKPIVKVVSYFILFIIIICLVYSFGIGFLK